MTRSIVFASCCGTIFTAISALGADPADDMRQLKLRDWQPRSMLITKSTNVERPLYPAIDARVLYAAAPPPDAPQAKQPEAPQAKQREAPEKVLHVKQTEDFKITGDGGAAAWKPIAWEPLTKRGAGAAYDARFKMLYSRQGVYVLMNGSDQKLTATLGEDFADLWNEDVFEFFFWTDERHPIYFEYEISPLGHELPILVPNIDGKFLGWRPWHYEGDRKTQKATTVVGGNKRPGAAIGGWTAEVFVPYRLLEPLAGVPPKPGAKWRANFYRVDYDEGKMTEWDWARVGPSFHEYQKFGTVVFE